MHASGTAHRKAALWLAATVGVLALSLASAALSQAEESNPNNYNCLGGLSAGTPVPGSEEQQVQYSFYCNGPITGYQVQSQIPVTGVSSPPIVTNVEKRELADTFSCSGEIPGWAANCVGSTANGYETVTGQFAIGAKLCAEPRVDALLTVAYAYLEKGKVTQAISGPYDLGRPKGCKPDWYSHWNRFNPQPLTQKKHPAKKGAKRKSSSKQRWSKKK
ncbi:MAG TPA: hypothetical protein VFU90_05255 [Candidatus Tumulicola sp.]|nr:hypothetical protein [Candidatus Tumulicola sp.]